MEYHDLIIANKRFHDLNPMSFGEQKSSPGNWFEHSGLKRQLIHYVISGNGVFYADGKEYPVSQGDIFTIKYGKSGKYVADMKTPWHYVWISFDGELSKAFDSLPPVTQVKSDIFIKMLDAFKLSSMREEFLASCLFLLYRDLFGENQQESYVGKVKNYIDINFKQNVKIEDIAQSLGLNRKYLSRIFKEETGVSMKQYLTELKMKYAKKALLNGATVSEVSAELTYDDPFAFSKMFKKHYGYPPSQAKKHK